MAEQWDADIPVVDVAAGHLKCDKIRADKTNICADMKNPVFYLAYCLQAAQPVPFF